MPTFEIIAPDGKKYQVTAPEGATEQQALEHLQTSLKPQAATAAPELSVGEDIGRYVQPGNLLADVVAQTAGIPGNIAEMIGRGGFLPTSADFRKRAEHPAYGLGSVYQPQTSAGKLLQAGAGSLPLAPFGVGGAAARVGQAVLPALAGEMAGQAAEGTPYETAARFGTSVGAGFATGRVTAGRGAEKTATALQQSARVTPEEVLKSSSDQYKAIRSGPMTVPADDARMFAVQARNKLASAFDQETAPDVYRTISKFDNIPPGATVTASDILNARQKLSTYARQTQDFKPTPQAAAAVAAKQELDDFVARVNPTLGKNIRSASNERRIGGLGEAISNKANVAELNAASANSGMNVENAIRQQVKLIVKRPDMMKRFTPEVQKQLRDIIDGNATINTMRTVGNLLGGGGGIGALGTGAIGSLVHPLGWMAPILGAGLKGAGNAAARKALDNVLQEALSQSAVAGSKRAAMAPKLKAAREAIKASRMSASQRAVMLQALQRMEQSSLGAARAEDEQ